MGYYVVVDIPAIVPWAYMVQVTKDNGYSLDLSKETYQHAVLPYLDGFEGPTE